MHQQGIWNTCSVHCIKFVFFCPASWNFHNFFQRFLWKKNHRTLALQCYHRNWTSSQGWPFPAWLYRCCQSHWHKDICSTPRSCVNQGVAWYNEQCFRNIERIWYSKKTVIRLLRKSSVSWQWARPLQVHSVSRSEADELEDHTEFHVFRRRDCKDIVRVHILSKDALQMLRLQGCLAQINSAKWYKCFPMQKQQQLNSSKLLFCWEWHRSDSWMRLSFCPSMLVQQKHQDVGPPAQTHTHASAIHDGIAKKSQEPIRSGCARVLETYPWIQPYANQDVVYAWDLPSTPLAAMPFPLWCGCWQGDAVPLIFASLAAKNNNQRE